MGRKREAGRPEGRPSITDDITHHHEGEVGSSLPPTTDSGGA
jgi:hypothetical protein